VADEVDLEEPGPGVVPLGEGAHRDLTAQQGARPRQRAALEAQAAALGGEQAVDRARRHGEELLALLVAEFELAVALEGRDGGFHGGREALAADPAEGRPDLGERDEQLAPVGRSAAAPPHPPGRLPTGPGAQQARRVAAVVAGEGAELVEHQAPLLLGGPAVAPRHLPRERLSLRHRQGHRHPPCRLPSWRQARQRSSTFLADATNHFRVLSLRRNASR